MLPVNFLLTLIFSNLIKVHVCVSHVRRAIPVTLPRHLDVWARVERASSITDLDLMMVVLLVIGPMLVINEARTLTFHLL